MQKPETTFSLKRALFLIFAALFLLFPATAFAQDTTPVLQILNLPTNGTYEDTGVPRLSVSPLPPDEAYSLQIGDEGDYDKYGKVSFTSNGFGCDEPKIEGGVWNIPGGILCTHESGAGVSLGVGINAGSLDDLTAGETTTYWLRLLKGDTVIDFNTKTFSVSKSVPLERWELSPPPPHIYGQPITTTLRFIPEGNHSYTITLFQGEVDIDAMDPQRIVSQGTLTTSPESCTYTSTSGSSPNTVAATNPACTPDASGQKFSASINTGSLTDKDAHYQLILDRNPPDTGLTSYTTISFSDLYLGISLLPETTEEKFSPAFITNFRSYQPVAIQAIGCPSGTGVDFSWQKKDGGGADGQSDVPVNKDYDNVAVFIKGKAEVVYPGIPYDSDPFSDGEYTLTATCIDGGASGTTSFIVGDLPTPTPPLQLCQTTTGKIPENCNTALGLISSSAGGFVQGILGILLSVSGMLALYFIVRSGYQLMMSWGDPEKIGEAKERLISAVVGLLLIIFSLVIMSVIGVNLLKIPGFE